MRDMTKGAPLGHLFLYALPLLLGNWLQLAYNAVLPKASPSGLRPQARVEAQPPEAALSAETEAVRVSGLMGAELANASREWVIAAHSPLIRPRAGPRPPSPSGEGYLAYSSASSKISCATSPRLMRVSMARFSIRRWASVSV